MSHPHWDEKRGKKLKTVFKKYMKDGKLDRNEVVDTLKDFGYTVTPEQADGIIKSMDRNGDGKIQFEEFQQTVKDLVTKHSRDAGYNSEEEHKKHVVQKNENLKKQGHVKKDKKGKKDAKGHSEGKDHKEGKEHKEGKDKKGKKEKH
eukprot:TRINITY_DN460_c0_g1_i2.p1 TRINITY_DN460_c0_g1~~TRINITY_DN460_c0_g1_i2.p1  ORF type:complete len:162 (+),score=46.37 TRINITY_DN460_c0_g1_i2:46-486(+)